MQNPEAPISSARDHAVLNKFQIVLAVQPRHGTSRSKMKAFFQFFEEFLCLVASLFLREASLGIGAMRKTATHT
jgi:hypothetical protein